jgi:hypothetical protein
MTGHGEVFECQAWTQRRHSAIVAALGLANPPTSGAVATFMDPYVPLASPDRRRRLDSVLAPQASLPSGKCATIANRYRSMNSRIVSTGAVYPAPSNTVELASWTSMNAPALSAFASARSVQAIAQLCGAVSRKPFHIPDIPRVAVPVRLPVIHSFLPSCLIAQLRPINVEFRMRTETK